MPSSSTPGAAGPTQQPFDVAGIDEGHDLRIMLIDLDQFAMLAGIVAGADERCESLACSRRPRKKLAIRAAARAIRIGLVVAPLFRAPDEILRVLEALGELTVDQLGDRTSEQHRRLLADGAVVRAELECATIGSLDMRVGPSRVGGIGHRQRWIAGRSQSRTLRRRRQPRNQRKALAKMGHGLLDR